MKKSLFVVLVILLVVSVISTFSSMGCKKEEAAPVEEEKEEAAPVEEEEEVKEPVTLIFSSWRSSDQEQVDRVLSVFNEEHPYIEVVFKPTAYENYYAQLGTALDTGTGAPDVFATHSFGTTKKIYDSGHLLALEDLLPELQNLPEPGLNAFSSTDGKSAAAPFLAVSHGFYYNAEIFKSYDLQEPETWDELIQLCETLRNNNIEPIASGAKVGGFLLDCEFSNYCPTHYGGEETRRLLAAGEIKVTDERFIKAFDAMKQLSQYYSANSLDFDYVQSQALFATGDAAMWCSGSWALSNLPDAGVDFELGWFPPPVVKAGDKITYCWNNDMGIGIYSQTEYIDECVTFMQWLLSPVSAQLFMNENPGFYTFVPGDYTFDSPLAKAMMDVSLNANLVDRTMQENVSDQEPSGNMLMGEALPKLITGEFTSQQIAEYVQEGLETWFTFK